MRRRILPFALLLITLLLPAQTVQASPIHQNSDGTTIYIPLVVANTSMQTNDASSSITDSSTYNDLATTEMEPPLLQPTNADETVYAGLDVGQSMGTEHLSHKLYLPFVSQQPAGAQQNEVSAAWWFPWFGWGSAGTTQEFSLKIEKRDFDAGGDGFYQTNLLLIPRIIDLLDILNLTDGTAEKVWGLTNTRLKEAQRLSRGSGVTVAVLDTGVSILTSELFLRTVSGYDFVDDDRYPYESPNYRDDDRDGQVDEGSGHGTFVSSIIAATTRSTRIMPLRVLNSDGNGTPENLARAIRYAADRGANIINLSLSSDTDNPEVRAAIDYAAGKGVVIVAAALSSAAQLGYPAEYGPVISVGSIDQTNTIPDFVRPNAAEIDLFAPGVDIYGPALYGRDVWMSGNSMATAFVTSAVALLMEGGRCDAACARTLLTTHVNPISPAQNSRGSIDVYAALLNRP